MTSANPDWSLYRSFLSVLRTGSLSAAARDEGLTQPTVGRHVDSLEKALGVALFTRFAYPAQVAACILLVASIAAIVLTLRRRTGGKPQNIAQQVAVRAKDRVRIVKMASEKRT